MKIYIASSWKNRYYEAIVDLLKLTNNEIYDFRNPVPGNTGFKWSQIDEHWEKWDIQKAISIVKNNPLAIEGYNFDINALNKCNACLLILPAGRSASWELGYAMGQGKLAFVYNPPEEKNIDLMFKEAKYLFSIEDIIEAFTK